MSITLILDTQNGIYALGRANALITTSAKLAAGDSLDIAGVRFYVDGFRHHLQHSYAGKAPTSFAFIRPLGDILDISPEALQKLADFGFEKIESEVSVA